MIHGREEETKFIHHVSFSSLKVRFLQPRHTKSRQNNTIISALDEADKHGTFTQQAVVRVDIFSV